MSLFRQLRWAVSLAQSESHPHWELLFRRALTFLSADELCACTSYVHRDDVLARVTSRLLARRAAVHTLGCLWSEVEFERSERGKPRLKKPKRDFHFNISHHGDFVVLASGPNEVGVDVMCVDEVRDRSAHAYVERMSRLFTKYEQQWMLQGRGESEMWTRFYRTWCLKESILKATGEGITRDLRKYDFRVDVEERYEPDLVCTLTRLFEDNEEKREWRFEESFVNERHVVAVCTKRQHQEESRNTLNSAPLFTVIPFEFLLEDAQVLNPFLDDEDARLFDEYRKKPWKMDRL